MRKLRITASHGIEIWKSIEGYEGYQVSTLGNVKSLNYHRTGKEQVLKSGVVRDYQAVNLSKDGKCKSQYIHSLVSQAFLPKWTADMSQVNHKNEVKTDNRVDNLEFCTPSYNTNYGTRNKRAAEANLNHPDKSKPILQFDKNNNLIAEYPSLMEAVRQTGINQGSISSCCKGKRQFAGGYRWVYKIEKQNEISRNG